MSQVVNNAIADIIQIGFLSGEMQIHISGIQLHGASLIVKGYCHHESDSLGSGEALDVHVAMLIDYYAFQHDRTSYTMLPMHVSKNGDAARWLEFVIRAEEDPEDGFRSSLEGVVIMEPPQTQSGWKGLPATEVEIKQVDEMLFFNLAKQQAGHDGTPQALIEMGTLRHDEHYPTCRLAVDISVLPDNQPTKRTLNMDKVIKATERSETNPGWGAF